MARPSTTGSRASTEPASRLDPSGFDPARVDWTPGLRLRTGSPTMLQDEMAAFEAQIAEAKK